MEPPEKGTRILMTTPATVKQQTELNAQGSGYSMPCHDHQCRYGACPCLEALRHTTDPLVSGRNQGSGWLPA
jgi:hypothetical protein